MDSLQPAGPAPTQDSPSPQPAPTPRALAVREGLERILGGGRRLLWALITLLAIAYVTFAGLEMARGAAPLPALSAGFEHLLAWLAQLARGDLGMSASVSGGLRPVPVSSILGKLVARSVALLLLSLFAALLIGVPLGAWSARRRHSNLSLVTVVLSLMGASLPSFFIALALQLLVIAYVRRTGAPAPLPVGGFGWDLHMVLPALVLAARPIAQIARVTFLALGEALDQDYVRTARAKGLSERQVWRRHVYRNAAIAILTTVITSLRFALSSLPVVELFFGWTGIGFNLLRAIGLRDDNLTVALLLSLGLMFIAINWLVDLSYHRLDPRLKVQPSTRLAAAGGLGASLLGILYGLRDLARNLSPWHHTRPSAETDSAYRRRIQAQAEVGGIDEVNETQRRRERRHAWRRATLQNLPLLIGGLIVLVLLVIIIAGPRLWPQNPYTTRGLVISDGQMSVPPFEPSAEFRWGTDALGRDILSLVLAGAYQTLSIAFLVVAVRLLAGFVLGATAGWAAGSALDRMIMGLSELLSAFPALILAMLLITALGIRQGPWVFVAALGFVGWGEIMQYVRAQTISIRPRPYIESALSIGLRTPELITRHVLPNLFNALIALAVLEIGAVLMLLGELGFIGIFIGGGAFAELQIDGPAYHYSDVPEWGALLANIRTYARSYPWTALYPSLAFVAAILGFNLLGEGLRRMTDIVGVTFGRLLNRRTVLAALILLLAGRWAAGNSGPASLYAGQSRQIDAARAYADVQQLAGVAAQGRRLDTPAANDAAAYIAAQFEAAGLQAAGEEFSYFQTRRRDFAALAAEPALNFFNQSAPLGDLQYRRDFSVFYVPDQNLGQVQAPVLFVGFGEMQARGSSFRGQNYPAVIKQDFSEDILLLVDPADIVYLRNIPRRGLLVVAPPAVNLEQYTLYSARDPVSTLFGAGRRFGGVTPTLWISEEAANLLLAGSGATVEQLRQIERDLPDEGIAKLPTGIEAEIDLSMDLRTRVPATNVIGHLPGLDANMDNQLIMVLAQYDGLGVGQDGTLYPGANDNASAIAVMLEVLRTWQEIGYTPNRTFLFVAYAGEGYETGQSPTAPLDATTFLKAKQGFSSAFEIESIVFLHGLGAGEEPVLELDSGGNLRLLDLFKEAAARSGVKARSVRDEVDLRVLFTTRQRTFIDSGGEIAPTITLQYAGWDRDSGLPGDTIDKIHPIWLSDAARSLSTALMVMGQELRY